MGADEHDDEDLPCYRHPDRMTALACITCDRPICPECAIPAPVGFKCPDDAKQSRAALAKVPTSRMASGIAAGTLVAFVGGSILAVVQVPFLGVILAYLLGMGVGEVTRRAAGGFRDHALGRAAAIAAAVGILALPALSIITRLADGGSVNIFALLFTVIGAVLAAVGAYNRAS